MEYKGRTIIDFGGIRFMDTGEECPDNLKNMFKEHVKKEKEKEEKNIKIRAIKEDKWKKKYLPRIIKHFCTSDRDDPSYYSHWDDEWLIYQMSTELFDLDFNNEYEDVEGVKKLKKDFPEYFDLAVEGFRNGAHDT